MDMPELRVPYDYVLPHRPRRSRCRLCDRNPRSDPPRLIRLYFAQGWVTEVEVCDGCYAMALDQQNVARIIPRYQSGGSRPPEEDIRRFPDDR
jgi:hypothetical protein